MLALLILGCAVPAEDACPLASNGTCDELTECSLGTDSTDCNLACDATPWPADIAGACAHDMAVLDPDSNAEPAAPTGGSGGAVGTWDGLISVRGSHSTEQVERHYRVYVPRRYDPAEPSPVIFALGGFKTDMYWLAEFTELNRMADRENFIVVYGHPEWRDFGSYDVFAWYVYNEAFQGDWVDAPDIAYLEGITEHLSELYNLDRRRIYVTGHSRGAALSIIAAFERPDLFAGYCAHAGFGSSNGYNDRLSALAAEYKVPGVLVHGEKDPDVNVRESDLVSQVFSDAGWSYGDDWLYVKIENATHEWQSQYNQEVWDFLFSHPNPNVQP
jgi:polyhydroxybutyrate depolymerase